MSVDKIDSVELGTGQYADLDEHGWLSIVLRSPTQRNGWWRVTLTRFDAAAALRLLELLKKHEEWLARLRLLELLRIREEWLVRERDGLAP